MNTLEWNKQIVKNLIAELKKSGAKVERNTTINNHTFVYLFDNIVNTTINELENLLTEFKED